MSWILLFALLILLVPALTAAWQEFKQQNRIGAIGIALYLSLILALGIYQIFLR